VATSFLLYSDLTTRTVKTKVGGTNFTFPTLTGGEAISLSLRFTQTSAGATVETFPNVSGMRAAIGRSDASPWGGNFSLRIGSVTTGSIPYSVTATDLQSAINAVLTSGLTCQVRSDNAAFIITFSDKGLHTIVGNSDLDPVSLIRVRTSQLSDIYEHEITLVQAPLAATNVWSPIIPPAPSVVKIQQGSTETNGVFTYPTIQNLTIPAAFRGSYVLTFGSLQTTALSVTSGTTEIASAINALFTGTGQTVSVTTSQASVATISFDGLAFSGIDQPLLGVSVISAPPGDNTLVLDLNTSGCYEALRVADTISDLYLEVEADILPDGQNSGDTSLRQTVTLFRQKISLQRPINWSGLEAASTINWAVPPGPSSYLSYDPNQIITGQQFYTISIGDNNSSVYSITHNLGTPNLHLTLRNNATGAILVNGSDYHAIVSSNTVQLTFPSVVTSGQVVAVISTAGPKSAFVGDIKITASQVTGLTDQLSTITNTVNSVAAILPTTTAGVVQNPSATAVTYQLAIVNEVIGYLGNASPAGAYGYLDNQFPNRPVSLLNGSDFDRELWNVPVNSSMLSLGRTLSIDWGVTLQALLANCGLSYNLVVEIGNYTESGGLAVTWNTGSPVFVQPIVMTKDMVTHSFGIGISRVMDSGVSSIRLDQQLYGIWSGNNAAAPSSANFAIRCRLIGLSTESSQSDPRAWISYGLTKSLTASSGASAAQASVQ